MIEAAARKLCTAGPDQIMNVATSQLAQILTGNHALQ